MDAPPHAYATPDADGYGDDPVRLTRPPCAPRTLAVTPLCPPAMHRPGPWRLEDYTLHRQLYKGKASLLYSATCKASGARVALKLYRKSRLSDLNWWQVAREVRLHARLAHPAIVDLYAAFEDADHAYLVQEYADGGDLYEALRRAGGRLREPRVAAAVVAPVLDALAYLHARGIVHRDIKPENVLLCRDGASGDASRHVVKLADFGLSICASLERPVTRAGTLDYMSPEVVVCPEKCHPLDNKERADLGYGAAVDVWAVGVLAYELVVGRPPFEAETRAETCDAITRCALRFPTGTSDGLRSYVTASCARVAASRPSAAAMRAHPWVLRHAPSSAVAAAAAAAAGLHDAKRPAGDGDGLGAVLQWAGAAGKTLTRLLAHGGGRHGGDDVVPAVPSAPATTDVLQRAQSGRPPLAPGLSATLSGAHSGGASGGSGGGTAPVTPVGEIKAWHGAAPGSPAAPAPSPAYSAALSPAPSSRVPSPWARSRSGRESPAAPRAVGLAAWRARRAAASGSLAVASASSGSLDLVDTPCRPGVAFPSGRGVSAAPPPAKRSLSSSLHAASSWSTMDTS